MEKYDHVFDKFIEWENLYSGYIIARSNKRYRKEVLSYTANLEENLIDTQNHLIWKSYEVKELREFIEYYPKKRIITVMPFANRVANCAAHNVSTVTVQLRAEVLSLRQTNSNIGCALFAADAKNGG